jgi:hypothetical protein
VFGFIQTYFPSFFPSCFTSKRQELMVRWVQERGSVRFHHTAASVRANVPGKQAVIAPRCVSKQLTSSGFANSLFLYVQATWACSHMLWMNVVGAHEIQPNQHAPQTFLLLQVRGAGATAAGGSQPGRGCRGGG